MQRLLLIRHAKSSWRHDIDDLLRPLNDRGYAAAQQMSQRPIVRSNLPDVILCSPAIRAYSTAVCLMRTLNIAAERLQICDEIYGASATDLQQLVAQRREAVVWLIGHNPAIHLAAELFAESAIEAFPTLAVAQFDFENDVARLQAFDWPKRSID
ncbi:histidine phosphatase family protein [Neiella marina]|uniref:Histidine phosphatase family protein n=1 Tax=Neiella holothuriorum TaxID=2870530 RepID=A0ABS7ED85_9GAMM|nr:histidine phosphatase family protein [Neiella holothuriorum]MBW8190215.1 histidine phosphatase family protein [Neiella holothuriorum]